MKRIYLIFAILLVCTFFFTGCKKDTLFVTFNANGGIGEMPVQEFERDVSQPLAHNAFYYEDYRFEGWNSSPSGNGKNFVNGQVISIKSDMTLYAKWVPLDVSVYASGDTN